MNHRNTHNLLQRCRQNSYAGTYKTFDINFHIGDGANTHTKDHNHNSYLDFPRILLAVKYPLHDAYHRNHAKL